MSELQLLIRKENLSNISTTFYYLGHNISYMCDAVKSGWQSDTPFYIRNALRMLRGLNKRAGLKESELYDYITVASSFKRGVRQAVGDFRQTKDLHTWYGGNFAPLMQLYYRSVISATQFGFFSVEFHNDILQMLNELQRAMKTVCQSPIGIKRSDKFKTCSETTEFLYALQNLHFMNGTLNGYKLSCINKKYKDAYIPFRPHELVESYNALVDVLVQADVKKKQVTKLGMFDCECDDDTSPNYAYNCCIGYYASPVCRNMEIALFNACKNFFAKLPKCLKICDYKNNIPLIEESLKWIEETTQKKECPVTGKEMFIKAKGF